MTSNDGPAHLFATTAATRTIGCRYALIGTKSNRDGIGASVAIVSASGKQWNVVRSGSSYASQSDLALVFGLGQDPIVNSIEVEWPSGTTQKFANVASESIHHHRRNSWRLSSKPRRSYSERPLDFNQT